MQDALRIQTFFTALPLAFGLLHLVLFSALPRLRSNLYYGLFLLLIAATIFFDFQEQVLPGDPDWLLDLRLHRACLALSVVFALRFFYEIFLGHAPRQFRWFTAALLITGAVAAAAPVEAFWPLQAALVLSFADSVRAMTDALRRRQEDAWLIAAGLGTFLAFTSYDLLLDAALLDPLGGVVNAYQFGLVGLFGATSAFLARGIARTSRQLTEQERLAQDREVERRLLASEVERTKAELEEARLLQLSLLPTAVPERPGLEIAAYLNTATEVGGDYYDFAEGAEGTLTIAVGDATGHGLRAGIMVALAKSLFQGLRDDEDLPGFFQRCTRVLKPMRLGNLFMALTLVRIQRDELTIAAAGMPPTLIYRARSNTVEEVVLKGMPLGAFLRFPYSQVQTALHPGDVLLLMTDGLEELFNPAHEMLGLERIKRVLREAAGSSPEEILARLLATGDAWRAGGPHQDDVTLLVLKSAAE